MDFGPQPPPPPAADFGPQPPPPPPASSIGPQKPGPDLIRVADPAEAAAAEALIRAGPSDSYATYETLDSDDSDTDAVDDAGRKKDWMAEMRRNFRDDVHLPQDQREREAAMQSSLASVPRDALREAVGRSRELGTEAFKRKDYKKAYEFFNNAVPGAIELKDPELPKYYCNRSACHLALGNAQMALMDAGNAIAIHADYTKGYFRAGRALLELGRWNDAEASFTFALESLGGWADSPGQDTAAQTPAQRKAADKATKSKEGKEIDKWKKRAHAKVLEDVKLENRKLAATTDYSRFDEMYKGTEEYAIEMEKKRMAEATPEELGAEDIIRNDEDMKRVADKMTPKAPEHIVLDFNTAQIFLQIPDEVTYKDTGEPTTFTGMVGYLDQVTLLQSARKQVRQLGTTAVDTWCRAVRAVGAHCRTRGGAPPTWLNLGAGTGVPILTEATLPVGCAGAIDVLPQYGTPFIDSMVYHLLHTNGGLESRVNIVRTPIELTGVADDVDGWSAADEPINAKVSKSKFGFTTGYAGVCVIDPDFLDEGLLGRRAIPYIRHAKKHLLAPNALVVPAKATVYAVAAEMLTPEACGFDIGEMDKYRWSPLYEGFRPSETMQSYRAVSQPMPVFEFDMNATDIEKAFPDGAAVDLAFDVASDATINCVVFYWSLDMLPDAVVAAGFPQEVVTSSPEANHDFWQSAVQWLDPIQVSTGQRVVIEASHNSTRVRFRTKEPRRNHRMFHNSIARWHMDMVADTRRNEFFDRGITQVISEMKHADPKRIVGLDFGSGSGLLGMMMARAGCDRVLGCDTQRHVVAVANKVVALNGFEGKVKNIVSDCRHLKLGDDLPERADLLVMELFDYGFLGEGCLYFAHHAWQNLLKPEARICPQGGTIFAMAVELWPRESEGFDVSAWNVYRNDSDYYGIDLNKEKHTPLTDPMTVFDIDLRREACGIVHPSTGDEKRFEVEVTSAGVISGFVFWHEMHLTDDITLSTAPWEPRTCWLQAFQKMEEIQVEVGMKIPLICSHEGSRVTFAYDTEKLPNMDALRTTVPPVDSYWNDLHGTLSEHTKKMSESCTWDQDFRREIAYATTAIATDPARLGRKGRVIEPDRAFLASIGHYY